MYLYMHTCKVSLANVKIVVLINKHQYATKSHEQIFFGDSKQISIYKFTTMNAETASEYVILRKKINFRQFK